MYPQHRGHMQVNSLVSNSSCRRRGVDWMCPGPVWNVCTLMAGQPCARAKYIYVAAHIW